MQFPPGGTVDRVGSGGWTEAARVGGGHAEPCDRDAGAGAARSGAGSRAAAAAAARPEPAGAAAGAALAAAARSRATGAAAGSRAGAAGARAAGPGPDAAGPRPAERSARARSARARDLSARRPAVVPTSPLALPSVRVAVQTERLPASTFRLPVEKIRAGYYSDSYFVLTKELLEAGGRYPRVTMQVFAKHHGLLGGIDEAIAVLRECAGRNGAGGGWERGWDELRVLALHEGEEISPHETVMTIAGDYTLLPTWRRSTSAASRAARW